MRKNLHLLLIIVLPGFLFIAGTMNNSGSPGGKTGSPLDKANCTQCHTGSAPSNVSWITSTIPESGWVPGETYTITLNASNEVAKKIGFEITAEDLDSKTGTFSLTDQSRTKLTNNNRSVTHTFAGNATTNGENSWEMDWKAPDTAEGEVTFYAAFNLANGDGTTNGDEIVLSTLVVPVNNNTNVPEFSGIRLLAYPNPASHTISVASPYPMQSIALINAAGRAIQQHFPNNSPEYSISLENLHPGIYFLKAQTQEGEIVHRIQKL